MTDPARINLRLYLGRVAPTAAPHDVMRGLVSAEVTRRHNDASVFRLRFRADRTEGDSADFGLLSGGLLKPGTRAIISVDLSGAETILIDGFVTNQELTHSRDFGGATLAITGEDVSYAMDRVQLSLEYPQLGDSAIVLAALAKYAAIALPEVIPTATDLIPMEVERTPQQNGTDRCYVRQLAAQHGNIFCVTPTPVFAMNRAYWGPPPRTGAPAPPLTIDMGSATNVDEISFHFDASRPALQYGMVQDSITELDLPLATLTSTRLPRFASDPALDLLNPLQARDVYADPRFNWLRSMADAQGITDASTDQVVTARGELDGLRYNGVLEAPGLVDVRGAGESFNGRYYVPEVTHVLQRGAYRQKFTLTREGVGSTIPKVA